MACFAIVVRGRDQPPFAILSLCCQFSAPRHRSTSHPHTPWTEKARMPPSLPSSVRVCWSRITPNLTSPSLGDASPSSIPPLTSLPRRYAEATGTGSNSSPTEPRKDRQQFLASGVSRPQGHLFGVHSDALPVISLFSPASAREDPELSIPRSENGALPSEDRICGQTSPSASSSLPIWVNGLSSVHPQWPVVVRRPRM